MSWHPTGEASDGETPSESGHTLFQSSVFFHLGCVDEEGSEWIVVVVVVSCVEIQDALSFFLGRDWILFYVLCFK